MSDRVFVGPRVSDLDIGREAEKISRVTLLVDQDHLYTAGDDSGRAIEKTVPWASQEMAQSVLNSLKNVSYKPFDATDGLLDLRAEIGDGITVGGMYSVLAYTNISFDRMCATGISAPGGSEIEDEYPYKSRAQRQEARELAKIRSSITKTAESITLLVENEIAGLSGKLDLTDSRLTAEITSTRDDLNSKIEQTAASLTSKISATDGRVSTLSQTVDGISTKVSNAEGDISKLEQFADGLTLSVSNGSTSSTISLKAGNTTIDSENITFSGFATFSGLSSGTTTINGACIKTGTIEANRLNLSGAITWNSLSDGVQNDINGAYDYAETAYDYANNALDIAEAIANGEYSGTFIDGTTIYSPTIYTNDFNIHSGGLAAGTFNLYDGSSHMLRISYDRDGEVIFSSPSGAICWFLFGSTSFLNNVNFWGKVHFGGSVEGISSLTLNSSSSNKSGHQIELMSETSENTAKDIDIKDENGSLKIELRNVTWYLDETGWHQ